MHEADPVPRVHAGRRRRLACVFLGGMAISAQTLADADLGVTLAAFPAPVVVERPLAFLVEVHNTGPELAQDVTVEIELPAELALLSITPTQGVCLPGIPVICQLGSVPVDESGTPVRVSLETLARLDSEILAAVSVASAAPDPWSANDSATTSLSIVPFEDSADLQLGFEPGVFYSGYSADVVMRISNAGPVPVAPAVLRVSAPALQMLGYVSASSAAGRCTSVLDDCAGFACLAALNQRLAVTCTIDHLAAGGEAQVRLTVNVDLPVDAILDVLANVEAPGTADPDPVNNSAGLQARIFDPPGFGDQVPTGPGGCFIATAVFGTPWAGEVRRLRQFRDRYLLTHAPGRALVAWYYRASPPAAAWLQRHEVARRAVGGLLRVVLLVVEVPVVAGLVAGAVVAFAVKRRRRAPRTPPVHELSAR